MMVKTSKAKLSRPPQTSDQTGMRADSFIAAAGDKNRPADGYPWEAPELRSDVLKTFNLRLPEPTKAKLQWLSEHSPQSMHQIAAEAVATEIERRLEEHTG